MSKIARHAPGENETRRSRPLPWLARCSLAAALALAATAADDPAAAQPAPALTTQQLIELLVKQHVLTRSQVNAMVQNAQGGAAQGGSAAPAHGRGARSAPAGTVAAVPEPATPAVPPGTVRVTYIPESVRQEIEAQVKQDVMQQAQDQGWAAPNQMPEWVQRIKISGDIRVRGEEDLLGSNNSPFFPNFQAINTSSNGFDVNGQDGVDPPTLDTTENRTRIRLRARLNVAAQIADWIDTDVQVGTGNDNSPVSMNQTLGTPGDFSKYALWLDEAFIRMRPIDGLTLYAGRSPNPFWTTDLLFYNELRFDGIAAQYSHAITPTIGAFISGGAFPVFNTSFNFGSTNVQKNQSHDSYLFAVQGGADWKYNDTTEAKIAVGYFDFDNVQGSESSPCFNPTGIGSCDTDDTVPGFVSFGNSVFPTRNIVQNPATPNGPQPELFGLASKFDVLDVHGQVVLTNYHPIDVVIDVDYLKNLGFNRNDIINRGPVNNLGSGSAAPFVGGNNGYGVSVLVGHQALEKKWDWNASIGYKYLESDAVLDSLTDPDFHLGGTNAKGYILTGNLALARNAYITAKWLSANQVSGPTYAADVLQVDLNAKF